MLDEEWLRALDFKRPDGSRLHGLVGVGSENVNFHLTMQDGTEQVLQTYRHHLGYYIKEIPLHLSETPLYDVDRLNAKLYRLVGNDLLDQMSADYDRAFSSFVRVLYLAHTNAKGADLAALLAVVTMGTTPGFPETVPFIMGTPMIGRRIREIAATPPPDRDNPRSWYPRVNGPNFPIEGLRDTLLSWATEAASAHRRIQDTAPYSPTTLSHNPLFIWGGAVLDGFFTDDELPRAATFIESKFGKLTSSDNAFLWLSQILAVCHLLSGFLKESSLPQLVKLAGLTGLMFDVHDSKRKVVATSINLGS